MNDEFKNVNFLDTLNTVVLTLSMFLAIILIFLQESSSSLYSTPTYPYRFLGIMLIPIGIINYFIFKLLLNWARDTISIKLYNKELVQYNKDIKALLINQTKFMEANLKKEKVDTAKVINEN